MSQTKLSPNIKLDCIEYSDIDDLIEQYINHFNFKVSEIKSEPKERHIKQAKTKEVPLF